MTSFRDGFSENNSARTSLGIEEICIEGRSPVLLFFAIFVNDGTWSARPNRLFRKGVDQYIGSWLILGILS